MFALYRTCMVSYKLLNVEIQRFKGVPHKYRPYVWMTVTNAQTRMNNSIGLYKNLLTKGLVIYFIEFQTLATPKEDPSDEPWLFGHSPILSLSEAYKMSLTGLISF